jgi:hypothetical protein
MRCGLVVDTGPGGLQGSPRGIENECSSRCDRCCRFGSDKPLEKSDRRREEEDRCRWDGKQYCYQLQLGSLRQSPNPKGGVRTEHEACTLLALSFLCPLSSSFGSLDPEKAQRTQKEPMDHGRNLLNTLFDKGDSSIQDILDSRQQGYGPPTTSSTTQFVNPASLQGGQSGQGGSPSITPISSATANSGNSNLHEGRQNLLSLLNSAVPKPVSAPEPQQQSRQSEVPSQPTQVMGGNNPSSSESSGKMLLEQLMAE